MGFVAGPAPGGEMGQVAQGYFGKGRNPPDHGVELDLEAAVVATRGWFYCRANA